MVIRLFGLKSRSKSGENSSSGGKIKKRGKIDKSSIALIPPNEGDIVPGNNNKLLSREDFIVGNMKRHASEYLSRLQNTQIEQTPIEIEEKNLPNKSVTIAVSDDQKPVLFI